MRERRPPSMPEGILSIQSHVAYGHVGNSAAVFPLQRLGLEVWPVNTVLFSNHTGYGSWRGHIVAVPEVEAILEGMAERGVFARTRAVLTGYLGTPELGEAILRTVGRVRAARPGALFVCDPVMGDGDTGFYVRPGIPELFRERIVPTADIVTPNHFELSWLSQREILTLADARAGAAAVRAMGPGLVVGTSLLLADHRGQLTVLADSAEGTWAVTTPHLDIQLNGTGDVVTALLLAWWLRTGSVPEALSRAVSAMYALVAATHAAGTRELVLVEAQDQLLAPTRRFAAERVG
jgi:pyridoxine kinase